MHNYPRLLELHSLAVAEGNRLKDRRELFATISREQGKHFQGIVGPRGAGKTVLLKQIAATEPDAFYLSADTLEPATDLFEVVKVMAERYAFRTFLLDEVHFLPGSVAALKQIYDFLAVRVVFTSSVAMALQASAHDLARRVRLHTLDYFSFREYLRFRHGVELGRLTLAQMLSGQLPAEHLRTEHYFPAYLAGGLLPFALEEPDPLPLLAATIEKIIERDIPTTLRLHLDEIPVLHKMVAFVGRSAVDGINYSTLSTNLGITKYKAEQYAAAFESAFVLQRIFPAGTNVLREPKILLVPPLRSLHQIGETGVGGLREDFFGLAMRQAGVKLQYLKGTRGQKTPDYLVEVEGQSVAMEIGGKGKGRSQFKGIHTDRKVVLAPDITPAPDRCPLFLTGFLA
jgi:predicted AAA+ superfamily ATPase